MQLLIEIINHLILEILLDKVSCDVKDVDGVGKIAENIDEGLSHLTTHVKVCVLVL